MITAAPLGLFWAVLSFVAMAWLWLHKQTSQEGERNNGMLILVIWAAASGVLPFLLAAFSAPPAAQFYVMPPYFAVMLWAGFTGYGERIGRAPIIALVGVHVFRLPLELVLDIWRDAHVVPIQMSFRGENMDILFGMFAALFTLVIWLFPRFAHPLVLAAFSLIGLGFLVNILAIVNFSSPTPLRDFIFEYKHGPDMLPAFSFPMVWIATMALMPAMFLHIALLRRLWREGLHSDTQPNS